MLHLNNEIDKIRVNLPVTLLIDYTHYSYEYLTGFNICKILEKVLTEIVPFLKIEDPLNNSYLDAKRHCYFYDEKEKTLDLFDFVIQANYSLNNGSAMLYYPDKTISVLVEITKGSHGRLLIDLEIPRTSGWVKCITQKYIFPAIRCDKKDFQTCVRYGWVLQDNYLACYKGLTFSSVYSTQVKEKTVLMSFDVYHGIPQILDDAIEQLLTKS